MNKRSQKGQAEVWILIFILLIVAAIFFWCFCFVNSPTGVVKVPMFFGSVAGEPLEGGLTTFYPWKGTEAYSTLPRTVAVEGSFLTSDKIELHSAIEFTYTLNGKYANKIRTHIGDEGMLVGRINSYCQSAVKEAAAQMAWIEVAVTKRSDFEQKLLDEAKRLTAQNLHSFGLDEKDAAEAITFATPVVKQVLPPERLAASIAEQQAAKEDLKKQVTLTEIANQVAKRREAEGQGIALMMKQLPSNFKTEEVAAIIKANAEYITAEALNEAVLRGQLKQVIFTGGTASTPTPSSD